MRNDDLIVGVAHLGIRVHDLNRSRAFYERLGFEFIVGPVGPEPVAILKHPAGIEINLILNASESSQENVLIVKQLIVHQLSPYPIVEFPFQDFLF